LAYEETSILWGRQFLNPYAFYDLSTDAKFLETMADNLRVN